MTASQQDSYVVELDEYGTGAASEWTAIDWSTHLRTAVIDERKVNYVDMGAGTSPAIVFIHGLSGTWHNWLENILPLSRDFRVIALDLPGFGDSEMPRDEISIPLYAHTTAELCRQLGIERATICGNSMGGMTSVRMALDFPDLVERIALVSPVGHSTSDISHPLLNVILEAIALQSGLVRPFQELVARRPRLRRAAMRIVVHSGDKLRPEMVYELMSGAGRDGFVPAAKAIFEHDFRPELANVDVPTLIVWGENDNLIGVGDAHRYQQDIPGSIKMILSRTGHMTMVERPEWFNRTLADFALGQL